MKTKPLRIGFVSTRLEGTDGVSLEAFKWARVLTEMGHECFYFAGACDRPSDRTRVVPEAHFAHPMVLQITQDLFDDQKRSVWTSEAVHYLWRTLERTLEEFIHDFQVSVLIVENALAIPLHVPLGLALTELIAQRTIPTIAHHHDFAWERSRFKINAASDYLQAAFPPTIPSIHNVVINTYAATELARRTGMRSTVIPNVMDFDRPPGEPDDYALSLRRELGISDDEFMLLQPTRIVPRKRIERSIELAARLEMPCVLVVSHNWGDEGQKYRDYLMDLAGRLKAKMMLAADRFNHHRGLSEDGRRVFSLDDAYLQADLVTYPSMLEGFGNAFLEAIYYRRPLVMSTYEIFTADIKPKGFSVVELGEFTSRETVTQVRNLLENLKTPAVREIVDKNYELGRKHYSYTTLRRRLEFLIDHLLGRLY